MNLSTPQGQNRLFIGGIMLAVLVWGIFHAVGAFGYNQSPWRAVMVLVCTLGFLGFWLIMLSVRAGRAGRKP